VLTSYNIKYRKENKIIIRQEKNEDYKSIYEINYQALKQKNESELIERIRGSKNFVPELSLIAEKNSRTYSIIKN
jgi:predicted N-acetyltransferase YhbS